ncbi:hypothetical protein GR212_25215 [Rhizobium lusitanum]|uniref:Uncharacterized protein n=1 Tax=Rhizobium lusitanum TaxID=293958 RepID=A0A6L9UFC8_9HYPH|nr:hypothetical protein [Rhizobium lusitanum]NEI72866.1 hypothetical protein [Rhizobium lusitanum]
MLKKREPGSIQPNGSGQIIAVLPDIQRSARYRVRLLNENFDRSIGEDDIDTASSSASNQNG